jgi:hypothetical protein
VPFGVVVTYQTARYGPERLVRRTVATLLLGFATVVLTADLVFLINYLDLVNNVAHPD